ncbi:MAG TPA: MFS transporter [Candidatus Limnocylindrales bacterium]|nr:MFS transporter [Candidatus Limnocylindrales bacterium]
MQSSSAMKVAGESSPITGATGPGEVEPINIYHWLVVLLAAGGWMFDCTGQRIFVLSREPALRELLGASASDDAVRRWGGAATFLLMVGWATGGIIFGLLSDRCGRVKAMVSTLLAYTLFSGLSGFAHNSTEFLVWRFLFGLGVGGMFGAATTLVAESVPRRFRTLALGSMQAFSALGNMLASALSLKIIPGQENFWGHYSGWQVLAFVSVCPAVMVVPMILILKEPAAWKNAKAAAAAAQGNKSVGSLADLFRHPRWRKNLLVGICLGIAGMVGLWGIAFFSPELITTAFRNRPLQAGEILQPDALVSTLKQARTPSVDYLKQRLSPGVVAQIDKAEPSAMGELIAGLATDLNRLIAGPSLYQGQVFPLVTLKKSTQNLVILVEKKAQAKDVSLLNRQLIEQTFPAMIQEQQKVVDKMRSRGTLLQDVGSLLGMFAFTFAAARFSRRQAFLSAFLLCLVVVSFVFYFLRTASDVYWMLPLMGFATLSVFAGYSIYFPEIFPTRLRGTGVGFCYNTVRYAAAPFPFLLGWLSTLMPFRLVAIMMCSIYLVGIIALAWAPETKGQPLPED